MVKKIPLSGKRGEGKFALVDDEDFNSLVGFAWHYHNGYPCRVLPRNGEGSRHAPMHKLLMSAAPGEEVDHVDGNGLNNTRRNLRSASHRNNIRNAKKRSNTSSRFKGVSWDRSKRRWYAYINDGSKMKYLGRYRTEEAAAKVYDEAAVELFGEYARLNLPARVRTSDGLETGGRR